MPLFTLNMAKWEGPMPLEDGSKGWAGVPWKDVKGNRKVPVIIRSKNEEELNLRFVKKVALMKVGERFVFDSIEYELKSFNSNYAFASRVVNGKATPGRPRKFEIKDIDGDFHSGDTDEIDEGHEDVKAFDKMWGEAENNRESNVEPLIDKIADKSTTSDW